MRRLLLVLCLAATPLALAEDAPAIAIAIGQPAPDFTLTDLDGNPVKLSDHRGKIVVLEWYNPDCPFVVYAHGEKGPLRALPKKWTDQGVVWLAINSNSRGTQGDGVERNRASVGEYGIHYPILLDEPGTVGRLYAAKNTPAMFVIDAAGTLVYQGAVDNAPMGKSSGQAYQGYVDTALGEVLAGKTPSTSRTKAYGCSVKYAG